MTDEDTRLPLASVCRDKCMLTLTHTCVYAHIHKHTLHTLQLPKQNLKAEMIYHVSVSMVQFVHVVSCNEYNNPKS